MRKLLSVFRKVNFKLLYAPAHLLLLCLIVNSSCTIVHKEKSNAMALELVNADFLYNRMPNPMKILVKGYDFEDIVVKLDSGVVRKEGDEFILIPDYKSLRATSVVIVYVQNVEIRRMKYRIVGVNLFPVVLLSELTYASGGNISKAELLHAEGIKVIDKNTGLDWTEHVDITGFEIINMEQHSDSVISFARSSNGSFSGDQRRLISLADLGSLIIIHRVEVLMPDESSRVLGYSHEFYVR